MHPILRRWVSRWFAKATPEPLTVKGQQLPTQQIDNWEGTWIGTLSVAALLAFSWIPSSYIRMVSWPYCQWWQVALLAIVGWGIWLARQFERPLYLLGHRLDSVILLVALSNGLATLTGEFPQVASQNLLLLFSYGITLYVLVNWLRHSPSLKMGLWLALVVAATITHTVSIALWRPTADMWLSQDFYAAIRNPMPLGHHNFVGGYCLLLLPITTGFALLQDGWRRWFGYVAIALNSAALYASGSRGALIGLLALIAVALPLYLFLQPHRTRKHWIVGILLCLLTIGLVVSNPRIRALASSIPAASSATFSTEQITDGPTKDRLFMLQAGKNILQAHPLLGVGPGNLSRVYNLYRPAQAGSGLELVQQLHNTPAQILAESGIFGFCSYLLWIVGLLKLGITLHQKNLSHTDRVLLYSIGASGFAYAVSSLTDYQLENIGIAITLTVISALLIHLANVYSTFPTQKPSKQVSRRNRRLLSLCLMLFVSLLVQTWARMDVGFYLAAAAQQDSATHNLVDANTKWKAASKIASWDPTYSALSSEQLMNVVAVTGDPNQQKTLSLAAIESLRTAVDAAPHDAWFNQNLAALLLPNNPTEAEKFASKAALLAPRGQHYTYYTLGCAYLKQQKYDQAGVAFVLEAIANPQFLTHSLWQADEFSHLLPIVVNSTIAAWQQTLSDTPPNSSRYSWLQQQIALTQWWHYQSPSIAASNLSPFIQAILAADNNPAEALTLLGSISNAEPKIKLLQAWLSPDQYIPSILDTANTTPEEIQTLRTNIKAHRDLRQWLTSITEPIALPQRYGLAFAYRNSAANNIRTILFAPGPTIATLISQLALFPPPPREFSQLDNKLVEIASQSLHLTTPKKSR